MALEPADSNRIAAYAATRMPDPPDGAEWRVDVRPGRTMPSEVTVTLRSAQFPRTVIAKASSQCGSFFRDDTDEWFFKLVVAGLAEKCLQPDRDGSARRRKWLKQLGIGD